DSNVTRSPETIIGSGLTGDDLFEFAPFEDEFAAGIKDLDTVIPGIGYITIPVLADGDTPGFAETAICRVLFAHCGKAKLRDEISLRIKDCHARIQAVDHVDVAIRPNGDAMRTVQLTGLIGLCVEDRRSATRRAVERLEWIFGERSNFRAASAEIPDLGREI